MKEQLHSKKRNKDGWESKYEKSTNTFDDYHYGDVLHYSTGNAKYRS